MTSDNKDLTKDERAALEQIAQLGEVDGQRATALLAIDAGSSRSEAAAQSELSIGQVNYAIRKFRTHRLEAFSGALSQLPAEEPVIVVEAEDIDPDVDENASVESARVNRLTAELDRLIRELRDILPDGSESPYSPLRLLQLVRNTVGRFTPDVQIQILQPFEGLPAQDLLDLETWKGIAYMIAYSARFQVGQAKDTMNAQLPDPLKPDTIIIFVRGGLDRVTPGVAKEMASSLEGATKEDLLDPEIWKGLIFMAGYSAQFQAAQTRDKLNNRLPGPFRPDTIMRLVKSGLNWITPDFAKRMLANFEGVSGEDLLNVETWKGVWYMINYSLQFQADQLRKRILGNES